MHRTIKKAMALIVTLCLLLSVIPMGAQAALLQGEDYITQQLSLGEDLVLHLRASIPDSAANYAKDAVGTISYAGKTATYTLDDMTPDENGMYDMPVEMAVAEMTDDIHALVEAKVLGIKQEVFDEHYTIRDYLVAIINGDYSQTTKDLCLELLNMGAWAQLYFNHNISNLANAGFNIQPGYSVPDEIPSAITEGQVEGIRFYGTSVRFLSQTAMRFYFKADSGVNGYTFTVNGAKVDPVEKDGLYYIETPGINPQNMSDVMTVNVTDGSNTLSVGYAPIWYFIRAYHNIDNDYSKGLMEAAYSYYKTAESYKTQICMDVEISTLSGNHESIGLGFYPLDFEGDINNYTDKIEVPTGMSYTVKLDQGKYLVDGEFKGIGITVLGGPAWDAKLEDGTTPDRHTIKITEMRLEGPEDRPIDLSYATIASGQDGTGYTNANAGGTATLTDGVITFANGFFTDGYKITFNEVSTYIELDMQLSTLSGNFETIGIGFYGYDFEGDINNHVDRIDVPTGNTYTVKLDLSKYLVDGEFPGIGLAVLGGPTWDAKLEDGQTPDRHNITISAIRLKGELDQRIDLSKASLKAGQNGTGYTNANAGGTAVVTDGVVTISNGFFTDGYKLLFVDETIPDETEPTEPEPTEPEPTKPEPTEPEPPVEEPDTYLCLDMLITTLGNSTDPIEVRFFPYNYTGSVGDSGTDSVNITAGTATTVKLNLDNYLVDGELTGIGFAIMGGPAWDAKLEDGYTPDRHTVTISDARLEGDQSKAFDLSKSTWASAANAGYSWANGSGVAEIGSTIVISNGFQYDGHKITLVEDTNTYIAMDLLFTTLSGSTAPVDIGFFPSNFEGDINNWTDKLTITAGTTAAIKLNAEKYMVDGKVSGIGFAIFGGPEWDAKLEDGYTPDRHTITISNARLEGAQSVTFDLTQSAWAGGNSGTGFTNANGSGKATIGETIVISDGFRYDGHKISLMKKPDTFLCMDLLFTTLGGSTSPVEIGFFPSDFEGDINNWTDKLTITAGTTAAIKLNAEKYMVDGKVSGIGFAIFGGPAWDAKLPDGYTPDRHTITISNARLEGVQSMAFDLSQSTWAGGQNGTGFTNANGSGAATVGQSIVITNGFQYDGHKITLVEDTNTYICMDLKFTTLGGSTDPVNIRLYNYNYEGSVGDGYTDLIAVNAGTTTKIKVKVDNYLVDGQLPGFGFAVFGGPEWNTQLEDGTYDRHFIEISNVRLEGVQEQSFDLNNATVANGTNGTGFTWANSGGTASIADGKLVVTGGYCYDAYEFTF